MATRKEIISSSEYWLTVIQSEVFRLLKLYMDENNISQSDLTDILGMSNSHVSKILDGNFNSSIGELTEISLALGYIPELKFLKIDDYLKREDTLENENHEPI